MESTARTRTIEATFVGLGIAALAVIAMFMGFTFWLAERYIDATGNLVHHDRATNQALLYIFSQASALGAAGGSLFVFQIIIDIAHADKNWFCAGRTPRECALVAFLIPFKGLVAGAMAGGVVGGVFLAVGGPAGLAKGHLLILGVSCVAGYSEQVMQRIVQYGAAHADHP